MRKFFTSLFLILCVLFACERETTDAIDYHFNTEVIHPSTTKTLVTQNYRFGIEVSELDKGNEAPLVTTLTSDKEGKFQIEKSEVIPGVKFDHDYHENSLLWVDYTPLEVGDHVISYLISNDKVNRSGEFSFYVDQAYFDALVDDLPERPLIDKKFSFSLYISEYEITDLENINAGISITRGGGAISLSDQTISLDDKQPLNIGKNVITYEPIEKGENLIKFNLENQYGYSQEVSIPINVYLPEWNIILPKDTGFIETTKHYTGPVQIEELDKFEINEYTGAFRFISGSGTLTFNSEEIEQGAEFPVKYGTNVLTYTHDESDFTAVEFIIKDRYKTENKDTLYIQVEKQLFTVNAKAGSGGIVAGSGTFEKGATCELEATPNTGYLFDGWYRDDEQVSLNTKYSFIIEEHISLEARFTLSEYTITATAGTGGSVTGDGTYSYGSSCTLTAKVNTGYSFDGWYENDKKVSSSLQYSFQVITDRTLMAQFITNELKVSIDKPSQNVKINQPASFNLTIEEVNYTGTFTVAYELVGGEGKFSGKAEQILSKGDHSFNFTPTKEGSHTLKFLITDINDQTKEVNATVISSISPLKARVNENTLTTTDGVKASFNLYIEEDDYNGNFSIQYKLSEGSGTLTVNNVTTGSGLSAVGKATNTISFTPSTAGNNILEFIVSDNYKQQFPLSVNVISQAVISAVAETGGTVSGGGNYTPGETCRLIAKPNEGYNFAGWYEGSRLVSEARIFNFEVSKSKSYIAKYSLDSFLITATAETGGSVTGSGSYKFGENCKLKAIPEAGYDFAGWYEGSTLLSESSEYSFTVDGEHTIVAKYKQKTYQVTATAGTGGSVSGARVYVHGASCSLLANPIEGYGFEGWYENNKKVSSTATYTFNVTESRTLEAQFTQNSYIITTTTSSGISVSGGKAYKFGENCTLVATVETGYSFDGWYEDEKQVSTSLSYTFTVNGSRTIQAKAKQHTYEVKVTAGAGGSATGSGTSNHGASRTVVATASTGYMFEGWYEDDSRVSTAPSYTFSVTAARTLEARFLINNYSITVTAGTGGSATGNGSPGHGTNHTVVATQNTGYTFEGWYEGNSKVSPNISYTFTVSGARILEARFTLNSYAISVTAGTGGSATGGGTYSHFVERTVVATANTGYTFEGWYEGTTRVSTNASYKFTVTGARTLEARFTLNSYAITVTAGTGGTVSGGGTYNHFVERTVVATAATGYTFEGWYEGNTKVSSTASYKFTVTGARTLQAKFTLNSYPITVTAGTGGKVTGSGTGNHFTSHTVTATADTGYTFEGWYEGTTKVSSTASYTFTVSGARTLQARFTLNSYPITVTAGTGGKVTGSGTANHGTSRTVVATADTGYTFEGWYEDNSRVSTTASYTFTVSGARTLEARFTLNSYVISVTAGTGGSATGGGTYNHFVSRTVTATASTGYTFEGWYEGNSKVSSTASYTFTVTGARTLEAKFTLNSYTITLTAGTGGSVSGAGSANHGTSKTVTATAATGYTFEGWYEGNTKVSSTASYTFTVSGARTLEAKFTLNSYTITLTAGTGGSVSGAGSANHGTSKTVTATANTGYTFEGWYEGSSKVSSTASYTFTVSGARTLEARFTLNSYAIAVSAGTGGSVSGGGTANHGTSKTVVAVANTGYTFEGWYEGSTKVSSTASYTFTVSGARTLQAQFTLNKYNIAVSAATAGGTVTGAGQYNHGVTCAVAAFVETGYTFDGWYEGGNRVSTNTTYSFTVSGARTLEARFTLNKYTITATATTGGYVNGSGSYDYGKECTVVATANDGYNFDGWFEGSNRVSTDLSYKFTVSAARTLQAKFTLKTHTITATAGTGGTVSGGGTYNYGTNQTVKATVNTGYSFSGWYEANIKVSENLSYTFQLTKDISLEARFTINSYAISVSAGTGGTVSGGGSANHGISKTITATAGIGYTFEGWYEGSTKISSTASYTFTVTGARTLQARFTLNSYTITLTAGTGGTVSGAGIANHGTNKTVTATANTGYKFEGWYEGNTLVSSTASYTFTVTGARTLQARFSLTSVNISVSAGTGGTVTGGGTATIGSSKTVTATVNTGYDFAGWYEGDTKVSSNTSYTFTVTGERTLQARFTIKTFLITTKQSSYKETISGAGRYAYGQVCTIKLVSSTYIDEGNGQGAAFTGWLNDANSKFLSTQTTYTFTVTQDMVIRASWQPF